MGGRNDEVGLLLFKSMLLSGGFTFEYVGVRVLVLKNIDPSNDGEPTYQ